MAAARKIEIPALRVHQWLSSWQEVVFDASEHRRRPPEHFYLLSISAKQLRSLSGIQRRSTEGKSSRRTDLAVQRRHNEGRSREIAEYVNRGYPWSSLSKSQRDSADFQDLVKPGWLPTALVVNILLPEDDRQGQSVAPRDLITVSDDAAVSRIQVPSGAAEAGWVPEQLSPIEVIDGQHRLWAFEENAELDGDFELPVVAFHGLDISWQAYLFYVINIKPAKINTSLAFDLYPLLRTEDWLERAEGPAVYRESRAQEITEALWSYPGSVWHGRIDMLGEGGRKAVTQAAWIRSLMATFIKSWEGRGVQIGGLFGSRLGHSSAVLPWTRAQQAAFVIHLWNELADAVKESDEDWALDLREAGDDDSELDEAFSGPKSLLNADQGVRAVMAVVNDLCWVNESELGLRDWPASDFVEATSTIGIDDALKSLRSRKAGKFVSRIAVALAAYDFRTYSAPGLSEDQRNSKARFRGGTGYGELRRDLLRTLADIESDVGEAAEEVLGILES